MVNLRPMTTTIGWIPPATLCHLLLKKYLPRAKSSQFHPGWIHIISKLKDPMCNETFELIELTYEYYVLSFNSGHIEMRYCDLTTSEGIFTPDCFDGNYLTFVEDIGVYDDKGTLMDPSNPNWHRMPVDSVYPERGMLSAGQSIGSKHSFEMKFQLPLGLSGDKILLQWKYIT